MPELTKLAGAEESNDVFSRVYRGDVKGKQRVDAIPVIKVTRCGHDDDHVVIGCYDVAKEEFVVLLDTEDEEDLEALWVSSHSDAKSKHGEEAHTIDQSYMGDTASYIDEPDMYEVLMCRLEARGWKKGPVLSIEIEPDMIECRLDEFAERIYYAWVSIECCNNRVVATQAPPAKKARLTKEQ